MKKTLLAALLAAALPVTVYADDAQPTPNFRLGAVDANRQDQGFLPDGEFLFRNQPDRLLCWELTGLSEFALSANVTETFVSPKSARFANAASSVDGTEHKISSNLPVIRADGKAPYIRHCWRMEPTDPLGEYSLQVDVNGVSYPAKTFQFKAY
ncbi:Uncharacterised protein [Bergeriella denitrificans]|uniref:Periplasmic protein n=2 Tax=Bergeriella denitrificans TaxID=494 RepID=A0A378UKL0_BERDE|nr:Uncharacterised protein [Bergeriella denitrificans]